MRVLFVKGSLCWPRSSGHDVHTYEMMRALGARGVTTHLLTVEPAVGQAVAGLTLATNQTFDDLAQPTREDEDRLDLGRLEVKFCSYWGIPEQRVIQVGRLAFELQADVVVAVGLDVLPYLADVRAGRRVWYAADEWVLHHLSQFSPLRLSSYDHLKPAAIKGLYERAFASRVDRVWVVSDADARAIRRVMGVRGIDVIPNGVDSDHFAPRPGEEIPLSCVFWGRLDFGPNLDALRWFSQRVWPIVKRDEPNSRFSVFGFQPGADALKLAELDGVEVIPDLPDIREEVAHRQLVVLPFVSGAGIKNKMLEAASMGRPIIASRKAMNGVELEGHSPVVVEPKPGGWAASMVRLWRDDRERAALGQRAREWVCQSHSWDRCARTALNGLDSN